MFALITGFFSKRATILITGVIVIGLIFGAGWYKGSTHTSQVFAKAAAAAKAEGALEQAKKNAVDQAAARKDYERRAALDAARVRFLGNILARRIKNPCQTVVSTEDMKALNDPALVGRTR